MPKAVETISLPLPLGVGYVNCYLIRTEIGYVLIDTGHRRGRADLEKRLESAGCRPGDLKLIIITHGDFDHTGNAGYLREKYGTKIAMHNDDSGMAERGDMFWNRKRGNLLLKIAAPILFGFRKSGRFTADLYVADEYDLSEYGLDARVVSIPGHSMGSIGILTTDCDVFCGDLFTNVDKPALNSIMDDLEAANASVERLRSVGVNTVYPGHGAPFEMSEFAADSQ